DVLKVAMTYQREDTKIDVALPVVHEAMDIVNEEGVGVVVDAQGMEVGHDD
ncbi:hypothetical protein KI387_024221, partial [Taxus chinensis]